MTSAFLPYLHLGDNTSPRYRVQQLIYYFEWYSRRFEIPQAATAQPLSAEFPAAEPQVVTGEDALADAPPTNAPDAGMPTTEECPSEAPLPEAPLADASPAEALPSATTTPPTPVATVILETRATTAQPIAAKKTSVSYANFTLISCFLCLVLISTMCIAIFAHRPQEGNHLIHKRGTFGLKKGFPCTVSEILDAMMYETYCNYDSWAVRLKIFSPECIIRPRVYMVLDSLISCVNNFVTFWMVLWLWLCAFCALECA